MSDLALEAALPTIQYVADGKASAFVRRCGVASDEREDIRSQLLLSLLIRWPKYDGERASVQTFASRVMDKELTSILRYRLALSRREQDIPVPLPTLPATTCGGFRIDVERALAKLPVTVRATALALFCGSTVEAAEELGYSRQIIQLRKRQIRAALESAGIGPRYFAGGSL